MPKASLNGLNPADTSILLSSASASSFFAILLASFAIMNPTKSVISAMAILMRKFSIAINHAMLLSSCMRVIKFFI